MHLEKESASGVHWSVWPDGILLASAARRMADMHKHWCRNTMNAFLHVQITSFTCGTVQVSVIVMKKEDNNGQNDENVTYSSMWQMELCKRCWNSTKRLTLKTEPGVKTKKTVTKKLYNRFKESLLSQAFENNGNRNVPLCQWVLLLTAPLLQQHMKQRGKTIPSAQDIPNHWQTLLYWLNSL